MPDHATIARFVSLHLANCSRDILAETTSVLLDLGEISGKTVFIDGTKIQANANKYTFVWKKAVTKNRTKLFEKITNHVAECEGLYALAHMRSCRVRRTDMKRSADTMSGYSTP